MNGIGDGPVVWTAVVVAGYPALAIALIELQRRLRDRFPAGAKVCHLLQITVLPPLALFLLIDNVADVPADHTLHRLVLSVLAITSINAALAALNALVRSGSMSSEWVQRTTGLVLDLARLLVVLVAAAVVASHIWAVDLGAMLTALGVGSVVLGLALQDTLSGLFAGVSLMSSKHFKEGDWIEVAEYSGRIVQMNWRTVTVETLDDNRLVVIPNSELARTQFTVLTSGNRSFGENIEVHFAYGSPPARVMDALEKAVLAVDLVLPEPPHDIDLIGLDEHGLHYEVTIHTRTRKEGEEAVTEVLRKLWYICQRERLVFAGAAHRLNGHSEPERMPAAEITARLVATGLFPADARALQAVVDDARHELYDDAEVLLPAGDPFTELFLVVEGRLAVVLGRGEHQRVVQQVGPGELFVGRALLTGAPATVGLHADGEVSVIHLGSLAVLAFLNENPTLARPFEARIEMTELGLATIGNAA